MDNKKIIERSTNYFLNDMVNNGASSASIMIYDKWNLQFYKSTSDKWQDFYLASSASENCHIVQLGLNLGKLQKNFSIVWDKTKPTNEDSIYLNEQRERFDHCHGISICETISDDLVLGVILTGRRCDVNFAELVIKEKAGLIDKLNNIITFSKMLYTNHNDR